MRTRPEPIVDRHQLGRSPAPPSHSQAASPASPEELACRRSGAAHRSTRDWSVLRGPRTARREPGAAAAGFPNSDQRHKSAKRLAVAVAERPCGAGHGQISEFELSHRRSPPPPQPSVPHETAPVRSPVRLGDVIGAGMPIVTRTSAIATGNDLIVLNRRAHTSVPGRSFSRCGPVCPA